MNRKRMFQLLGMVFLPFFVANAQEIISTDQNPNFNKSLRRYLTISDSLLRDQGSTVQQTYKAYDWYLAREERKALRRERRHLERMANPYYSDRFYPSIGFGYFGYSRWGNRGWSPYGGIGFNTRSLWY
ncbi:hypothetical protein [Olivibacter sp. XZL3]|uniref:hypothetical protein n=1 Tax=Olivibacter sp. XZL3 TaxID=1735116 RepID=UPI00106697DB|nr:hypothetical protein [Olivibacter sp. XZL3]